MFKQPNHLDREDEVLRLYYEDLASEYDNSRFDNSYGRYIDCQEREILSRWLGNAQTQSILDLACGTGRFLSLATAGLDLSPRMIEVARTKHPDKEFIQASASHIPIEASQYDAVFSLHLFMHLSQTKIKAIVDECYRILRPNGILIFDIPSAFRRKLISYKAEDWHGATSFSQNDIHQLCTEKWQLEELVGVNFLPIHRFPHPTRPLLLPIDKFLSHSFLKSLSSYYFVKLIKL
ncbi:class I SAM-dependent methyltransferase [Allocoleopsis franciscana]|uniref:Methylase involved in ubiquinone/menaquinone biosynthesis n=1 Tax=Allocoleopsis franciscana PCC 7113 TaxID=1173027 RepID=K9WAR2_9CYAN|nr:class I SAM-dependent methyltransferase [Allocoleopsis franciscana]AFZ16911.1 methylase involved in ubiquinone/menaquinone biosynthesis [Allocoleopsis franciscana PCC 7113]